jgi:hypothetical protein
MDQNNHGSSSIPSARGPAGESGALSAKPPIAAPQTAKALEYEVSKLHLADDGDIHERQYWPIIKERFPHYERYWRLLVVPMTRRFERGPGDPTRIRRRDGVAEDVWIASYLNYSLFLHLTAAFDHLHGPLNSSFSDFYSHLGSACNLAEDFLLQSYLVVSECNGKTVPILQEMSKEEFLEKAAEWYDKCYPDLYENCHKKGKGITLYLPARDEILKDYFTSGRQAVWKAYESFSMATRQYRNRIVHDVAIGNVLVPGTNIYMVPRKERIQDYRSLQQVVAAAQNADRLKRDFVVREEQMFNDFQEFQQHLNALWEVPIADFYELLYEKKNPTMLKNTTYSFSSTAQGPALLPKGFPGGLSRMMRESELKEPL